MAIHSSVHNLYNLFTEKESLAKMILIILLFVFAPESARCQYSFTISAQYSGGKCENMQSSFNSVLANHAQEIATGFDTKSECEMVRAGIIETAKDIEALYQGVYSHFGSGASCSIKVISSPCTSRSGIRAPGDIDISANGRGGAMFFENPAVEVSNWAKENEKLMSIIGGITDATSFNPRITGDDDFDKTLVLNIDKPFVSVNMREGGFSTTSSSDLSMRDKVFEAPDYSQMANMDNVYRYINKSTSLIEAYLRGADIVTLLHKEFYLVSGFDVDVIMNKLDSQRTEAERQALNDYREYRKEMLDKMVSELQGTINPDKLTKEKDMAILACAVYDENKQYIDYTDYRHITSANLPDDRLKDLMDKIDLFNGIVGFNCQLYYNDKTDEYTLSFEGSRGLDLLKLPDFIADWALNNIPQGIGQISPQFIIAAYIGDKIKDLSSDININIVGHSLGGGLASLAGVISGKPTYTYNAEGVNDNILLVTGVYNKVQNGNVQNITAYYNETDPLTQSQQWAQDVDTKDRESAQNAVDERGIQLYGSTAIGIPTNIGNPSVSGHGIEPIAQHYINQYTSGMATLNRLKGVSTTVEYQTQETIMIYTGE